MSQLCIAHSFPPLSPLTSVQPDFATKDVIVAKDVVQCEVSCISADGQLELTEDCQSLVTPKSMHMYAYIDHVYMGKHIHNETWFG